MKFIDHLLKKFFTRKLWPFWFMHLPAMPVYLWYALRARSLTFFTALNPSMTLGGFAGYSKWDIHKSLNPEYVPRSIFISKNERSIQSILNKAKENKLDYPLILKPDQSERGWKVREVNNHTELRSYFQNIKGEDILIQEFIDYPIEMTILYYRFPGDESGSISSVAIKNYPFVIGDGVNTLKRLLRKKDIPLRVADEHIKQLADTILPKDQKVTLHHIGNLSKWSTCTNAAYLINADLVKVFDKLTSPLTGFYYGRFDLKTNSIEDLLLGRNIKLLELNGANCQPTHVFDDSVGFTSMYTEFARHWKRMYRISMINHSRGTKFTSFGKALAISKKHIRKD